MIIQTGQRTDIPAFYSQWLLNRLKEGYVMVRNPFYPSSVSRYELNPQIVDLITFCTKNPLPVLQNQELWNELSNYNQWWYVSLTPYGKEIEPNVPEKAAVADAIIELGKRLGAEKSAGVMIRFLSPKNIQFHIILSHSKILPAGFVVQRRPL